MKALKIIGISVLALIVIATVCISFMSPKSHMERSIVVKGSPASVLEEFANFKKFNEWAPWAKMDPQAKYTYDGPESGVGAKMSWDGPETGKGSQETIEYEPGKRVKNVMKFDMMEGAMFSEVVVEEVPEGTKVTWYYDQDVSGTGPMNAALGKFFGMNMDAMMGPQYEEGLTSMKKVVESKPQEQPVQADTTATQPAQPQQ
jgi:hypothetical protein